MSPLVTRFVFAATLAILSFALSSQTLPELAPTERDTHQFYVRLQHALMHSSEARTLAIGAHILANANASGDIQHSAEIMLATAVTMAPEDPLTLYHYVLYCYSVRKSDASSACRVDDGIDAFAVAAPGYVWSALFAADKARSQGRARIAEDLLERAAGAPVIDDFNRESYATLLRVRDTGIAPSHSALAAQATLLDALALLPAPPLDLVYRLCPRAAPSERARQLCLRIADRFWDHGLSLTDWWIAVRLYARLAQTPDEANTGSARAELYQQLVASTTAAREKLVRAEEQSGDPSMIDHSLHVSVELGEIMGLRDLLRQVAGLDSAARGPHRQYRE
jgi:hypothetical protein